MFNKKYLFLLALIVGIISTTTFPVKKSTATLMALTTGTVVGVIVGTYGPHGDALLRTYTHRIESYDNIPLNVVLGVLAGTIAGGLTYHVIYTPELQEDPKGRSVEYEIELEYPILDI